MTTRSMWSQVVKEEESCENYHWHIDTRAAKLNGRHDNSIRYFSPVGDVVTLPPLSSQRVPPLPRPRSTFDPVWNAAAGLLHPAEKTEEEREEKKGVREGDSGLLSQIRQLNTTTRRHKALKWTVVVLFLTRYQSATGAKENVQKMWLNYFKLHSSLPDQNPQRGNQEFHSVSFTPRTGHI